MALISFAVTAKLICAFGFEYADCWFSHAAAFFSAKVLCCPLWVLHVLPLQPGPSPSGLLSSCWTPSKFRDKPPQRESKNMILDRNSEMLQEVLNENC